MQYIHISIDDISYIFEDITEKDTLRVSALYRWFIKMHMQYGCCFSLYVQNWNFLDEKLKEMWKEINQCSSWLRLGIHTTKDGRDFSKVGYDEGKFSWENFCATIVRLGGTNAIIDRFPRLHTFSGSKECLQGMADATICPPIGFLSADDSRSSYYLSEKMNNLVYGQNRTLYDGETNLFFKATDLRLDWFGGNFKSPNQYYKPVKRTPYQELVYRHKNGEFENREILTIFTHEWQIYKNGHLTMRKKWIEDTCKFARKYGYKFAFPMDIINRESAVSVNGDIK